MKITTSSPWPYTWLTFFITLAALQFANGDIWWGVANVIVGLALFALDVHNAKKKAEREAEEKEALASFNRWADERRDGIESHPIDLTKGKACDGDHNHPRRSVMETPEEHHQRRTDGVGCPICDYPKDDH